MRSPAPPHGSSRSSARRLPYQVWWRRLAKFTWIPEQGMWCRRDAVVSLDVRHPADSIRKASSDRLLRAAEEIAMHRGLQMTHEPRLEQASVVMDRSIAAMLDRAVDRAGFPAHRMSSGAGHDAMIVAAQMPAGMLFLRCANGISHHPAESVREEDVAAALDASVMFLDELGRRPGG